MYNSKKVSLRKNSDNNYENNSPSEFVEEKKYEPMSYEQARQIYGSPKYIQDQVHDHPELAVKYNDQRINSKHQFSSAYRTVSIIKEENSLWKCIKRFLEGRFAKRY